MAINTDVYQPALGLGASPTIPVTPPTPAAPPPPAPVAQGVPANNLQRMFPIFMNSAPPSTPAIEAAAAAMAAAYGGPAYSGASGAAPVQALPAYNAVPIDNAALRAVDANNGAIPAANAAAPAVPASAAPAPRVSARPALPTANTGTAVPRAGGDAVAPATVGGTPDWSNWASLGVPNSETYDANGNIVGRTNEQGRAVGGGPAGLDLGSLPGGGRMIAGRFVNPLDATAYGYALQQQYQRDAMANLASYLSHPGFGGTRASALAAAIGQNNFGQVATQGYNTINQGIGNIAAAGAGAGGMVAAARINADAGITRETIQQEGATTRQELLPHPTGAEVNPANPYAPALPTYSTSTRAGGLVPIAPTPRAQAKLPPAGTTHTFPDGVTRRMGNNGQWAPVN